MMMSDGSMVGDGSWELRILVTDLQTEKTLRVRGDTHIGGVMLRLVEDLGVTMDWSDHALWWPGKNMWLTRTRSTLDQYGVQADANLHFTPMHKMLRVQLPDLRYIDTRVDFSIKTFNAVVTLCKELGIRYPEELSFCKPLTSETLKVNYSESTQKKRPVGRHPADTNTFIAADTSQDGVINTDHSLNTSMSPGTPNKTGTPISSPVNSSGASWKKGHGSPSPYNTLNGSYSPNSLTTPDVSMYAIQNGEMSLAHSPQRPSAEAKSRLIKPRTLIEKARMNIGWLDSSLSIMEQGVREFNTLLLRFKFFAFYDLNPKYDEVRINQIYEQAKNQILNEEIDCTEQEMFMFAALQLQSNLRAGEPQSDNKPAEDDIDAALTDLQVSLEGSHLHSVPGNITHIPELKDNLRFLKPKRFTFKTFKTYFIVCKDLHLTLYKSKQDMNNEPVQCINLRGCEVTPDVNLSQSKYGIKLEVPSEDGMSEMWLRCNSEDQYARWMAACRMAAKGKTMADSSYDAEVKSISAFLAMQRPAPSPAINPAAIQIDPEDYVPQRFIRKLKNKLVNRILEAHANVKDISLVDAKLQYIKAWQSLPDYGISLFIVKFMGHKKEELLGIAFNRIMKMDMNTGDLLKTWRYSTMKAWNVNWEVKHMMVQFEEGNVVFACLSADCKVVHEFIGGYIFLSMRSKEASQALNEEMFHKLTGGWV